MKASQTDEEPVAKLQEFQVVVRDTYEAAGGQKRRHRAGQWHSAVTGADGFPVLPAEFIHKLIFIDHESRSMRVLVDRHFYAGFLTNPKNREPVILT